MTEENTLRLMILAFGAVIGFAIGAGWMEGRIAALAQNDFERLGEMLSTDICNELAGRRVEAEIFSRGGLQTETPEEIEARRRRISAICVNMFAPALFTNN